MKNIEALVLNTNIKLTSARVAILEIFAKSTKPLSYEDIKENLLMDKATFYRNISKFEEENIVNSFESNDKKRYFEIKKNAHSHFVCSTCSKIECLSEKSNISLPGYKIENVIIKGICQSCMKEIND
ncbi:MAG: Fur family transcriptional regulator [Arcobacter sp.]|nr:MAG: Fur family transcriptional regulator [Arcobacter sp.]